MILWQGAEGQGGLRTPDFQVTNHAHQPFGQKDFPLCQKVRGPSSATSLLLFSPAGPRAWHSMDPPLQVLLTTPE